MLWQLKHAECNLTTLREALVETCAKRGSAEVMDSWDETLSEVPESDVMQGLWAKYVKMNSYAAGIALEQACETAKAIMAAIGWGGGRAPDTSRPLQE